jgi:flagellar biosynthesis protein FlhG
VRVIAVASGKGGVGKTNVVANLAVTLARRGTRVWVLDADVGLGNLDIVYGVRPTHTIEAVLRGERRLADVVTDGPAGVRLVAAASGAAALTALTPAQQLRILDEVDALDGTLDVLLIDVAAGISSNVVYFAAAATETLVVTTPEPTAVADAYALVKVLATRWDRRTFPVLINMATSAADAEAAFARLDAVARRFLPVRLDYAGWLPLDDAVPRAVRTHTPLVLGAPGSPAARALGALADRLEDAAPAAASGGLQFFFRRLVEGRA